jgi:hypothetical protein
MARIAARDRPYERDMARAYIDSLRLAYDGFVAAYSECPVLAIDTDDLDIVQNADALSRVRERIRAALRQGTFQQTLPQVPVTLTDSERSTLGGAELDLALSEAERRRDTIGEFVALTQGVGDLGAALLDGGEVALREAAAECLRRLKRAASAAGIDLNTPVA